MYFISCCDQDRYRHSLKFFFFLVFYCISRSPFCLDWIQSDFFLIDNLQPIAVPAGCNVDAVNYIGNDHDTAQNRPVRRDGETEDILRQHKLQISLNNFYDEADRSASIPNPNAVSTGLRLSYDDDERNSSVTSASGSMATLPVMLSLGDNVKTEIDRQKEEFDNYIRLQVWIASLSSVTSPTLDS